MPDWGSNARVFLFPRLRVWPSFQLQQHLWARHMRCAPRLCGLGHAQLQPGAVLRTLGAVSVRLPTICVVVISYPSAVHSSHLSRAVGLKLSHSCVRLTPAARTGVDSVSHPCSLPALYRWGCLHSGVNWHERGADGRMRVSPRLGVRRHQQRRRHMRCVASLQEARVSGRAANAWCTCAWQTSTLPRRSPQESSHRGHATEAACHALSWQSQYTYACSRIE